MNKRQSTIAMNQAKNEDSLKKKRYSRMKIGNASIEDLTREKHRRNSNRSLRRRTSQRTSSISLVVPVVHCSCGRLEKELFQFIDEFIASQEYRDYLTFKASIIKKNEGVQYDINDLNVTESEPSLRSEKKIDMSRRALRVFVLERQIEKYASNLENAEILKKQEEAIRLIRLKIAEVKSFFFCHQKQREYRRKAKQQAIIQKFLRAHNIDVSRMLSMSRLNLAILDVERKLRMKRRRHKNNIKSIVEKLVKEYKQKRTFHRKKQKVMGKFDVQTGGIFHLKGKVSSVDIISSVHIPRSEDDKVLKAFKEAGVCIEEKRSTEIYFSRGEIGADEGSQPSSDASLQEGYPQNINSELLNEEGLYKIYLDDYANQKLGIMKSFVEFENTLEARHFFCLCEKERKDKEKKEIAYPDDIAFVIKPTRISVKNFRKGKIYKKQIVFNNISGHGVKIRLLKIYTEDPGQAIYFELETDEMKVALPGLPLKYTLIFKPTERMNVVVGCLVFLICNKLAYYRRIIPIECVPSDFDLTITPPNVSFGSIPIWMFLKLPVDISKILKVKCSSNSSYKIIVKKVLDPFELSTISSEDEYNESTSEMYELSKTPAEIDVETILDDILQEVESDFRIDRRFLKINGNSEEQEIVVSLSADKHPGFFIEKYQFDIYEVNDVEEDEYKGIQEITLTLEVTDYPIKCYPLYVDLGICFFSVAYQTKFQLINTTSLTQPITVKIPSSLSYYVSTDEKKAFLRSGETREVTVKFLPTYDLVTDKSKFYDSGTDILSFPVQVKLLNKQYADAPPLMQPTYAILCDGAELKLGPVNTYHYGLVDERMELDMGDCSVNETVVTQIALRNTCCSIIYYCFKNLPKYVTIMPNYGVGSIEPCQEIILKIFIHPKLDDFEGGGMDTHVFNEEKQFQISVVTIDKIGKYRRKADLSRLVKLLKMMLKELRKTEDISIFEDICIARCTWRTEMVQCTCESTVRKDSVKSTQELDNIEPMVIELKIYQNNFGMDAAEYSDVSSMNSIVATDIDLEVHVNVSTSKKKKGKYSKRKTRDSSNLQTISTSEPEFEENLETIQVRPLSAEIAPQIPTNSIANFVETMSSSLFMKTIFIKPLYEFSFNHIEFPATPGACYSLMMTELRPLRFLDKSCSGAEPGRETSKYRAIFRIAGSTEEVRIEPTCGTLNNGESITLTLVASPKINDDVVAAYAFERKRSVLLQEKLAQIERERKEKQLSKKKVKNKSKKKKSKERNLNREDKRQENGSPPMVLSDEVVLGILDFYPAEIAIWRSIEPYFLNVNFVCHVEYEIQDFWYHPPDVFSLETICEVIRPDFIHDQKSQMLDFGQLTIGESKKKIITIQNIKYNDIIVRTSILRPHGSFSCPSFDSVRLPSESYLKIPITYSPSQEEKILEYMEIQAERTVYQFVLTAESIQANIRIEPAFKVVRVVSRKGKTIEVPFEIKNGSDIPVTVSLEKVCELEGRIIHPPRENNDEMKGKNKGKDKKKTKKNRSPKSSPSRKIEQTNFSDELTENEIFSIENGFQKVSGSSYFDFKEETGRMGLIENSRSTVKILFGQPSQIHIHRSQAMRLPNKRKRKLDRKTPMPIELIGKTLIAKFNVLIGSSVFLRDFIIIGEFK